MQACAGAVTIPILQQEKLTLERLNNLVQVTYLRSTDPLERTVENTDGLVGLKNYPAWDSGIYRAACS